MPATTVRDYYTTAERYGSNADLQRLFERAHELGMHVLLDLVPGHSAVDNPWFSNPARTNATHGPTATSGDR